ncbi:sodium-coupled monocarboxylate transporter 2-like [Phlebotomus argentipes]|uniref:sodium-coupled monocarboxylate transporter 2-like n=1 Tax=Phlebotomus argentipes TaxID=94469 RepID=UPI0028933C14|nr:sodium-coupled monocarboxylate transporter 2-like [Phlebotomus argentipes]
MSVETHFSILDYVFFAIVFVVSLGIGLVYALRLKKGQSLDEYLFGGRKLGVVPVSLSLIATTVTGSSTIGQSMEVYGFGLHNWMFVIASVLWGLLVHFVFLPVFYDLQLMSSFAYLEMRFDKSVKYIASILYVITGFFVIPLTLYVPALAFQEVTGINLYAISVVTGFLCIWYTAIGGYKTVVWTDVFQFILIITSAIVIMIVGLSSVGGFRKVWEALDRGKRLTFFKTDLSLEIRGSMWAYLFSSVFILCYQFSLSQSGIQRYLSLPTLTKAKKALWLQIIFSIFILLIQFVIGSIIYTTYESCDPLTAGIVKKIDQIFPLFVQEKASAFTGFNGIFIAGVFAAGLSTTSTLLNTMSGTIYVDFLSSRMKNVSERTTGRVMKILVAIVGVGGIALMFLIERLGTIFSITVQCFTISTVGVFGLFSSGMIFPKINCRGAKCGVIVSMAVIGVLIIGGLNKKPDTPLPLRTDGCNFMNSSSLHNASRVSLTKEDSNEDVPWIFRINFQFFCIIGLIINLLVGYTVSVFTGGNTDVDDKLLITFLRKNPPQEILLSTK